MTSGEGQRSSEPGGAQERSLVLSAGPDAVSRASHWLRQVALHARWSEADRDRADLCISELTSNIASYGARGGQMPEVRLFVQWTEASVVMGISDDGVAFDPLSESRTPANPTLEQAGLGGHGIRLVRSFSDQARYRREAGRNVLTVHFERTAPALRVDRGADRRGWSDDTREPPVRERRSGADRRRQGYLSRMRLFRGVPYGSLEAALAGCGTRTYRAGEVLVRPGAHNELVGLLLDGRLRVHLDTPSSADYIEILPGECIGEMSVIDGKPVSAYVIADVTSTLLVVDGRTFVEQLLTIPRVARNLVSMLAERMRRSNRVHLTRVRETLELERIRRDIDFAAQIQAGMLAHRTPMFPERADIDCAAGVRPAREVGGDFYDAFFVDPQRLFFAIGDVCGKGLPAALLMVRALTLLRAEASRRRWARMPVLAQIVDVMNQRLMDGNDAGLFLSLFCGVLDLSSGALWTVNAGHDPPLVVAPGEPPRVLGSARNPVIALARDLRFEASSTLLPPGSALLAFTDGVTEAENSAGDWFGEARLAAVAAAADAGTCAQQRVDGLLGAVDAFAQGREQADDITVLVVRRP